MKKTEKVRTMDETTTCSTTVVDHEAVLLACALCGPVGVYLCGSRAAVLHHMHVAHQAK